MELAYSIISQLLAQIALFPASSAEVERVFSTMNTIKTPIRNCSITSTMDNLIRLSMDGDVMDKWDPILAALTWISMGNRKIKLLQLYSVLEDSDNNLELDSQ